MTAGAARRRAARLRRRAAEPPPQAGPRLRAHGRIASTSSPTTAPSAICSAIACCTLEWQRLAPDLGYVTPPAIVEAIGAAPMWRALMDEAAGALSPPSPPPACADVAAYVLPMALPRPLLPRAATPARPCTSSSCARPRRAIPPIGASPSDAPPDRRARRPSGHRRGDALRRPLRRRDRPPRGRAAQPEDVTVRARAAWRRRPRRPPGRRAGSRRRGPRGVRRGPMAGASQWWGSRRSAPALSRGAAGWGQAEQTRLRPLAFAR